MQRQGQVAFALRQGLRRPVHEHRFQLGAGRQFHARYVALAGPDAHVQAAGVFPLARLDGERRAFDGLDGPAGGRRFRNGKGKGVSRHGLPFRVAFAVPGQDGRDAGGFHVPTGRSVHAPGFGAPIQVAGRQLENRGAIDHRTPGGLGFTFLQGGHGRALALRHARRGGMLEGEQRHFHGKRARRRRDADDARFQGPLLIQYQTAVNLYEGRNGIGREFRSAVHGGGSLPALQHQGPVLGAPLGQALGWNTQAPVR